MTAEIEAASSGEPMQAVEVTAAEFFEFGKLAHRNGQLDVARQVYDKLLEVDPDNAEVAHFLGLARYQSGDREAGIALLRRSVASPLAAAGWWSNYGNVLRTESRLDDAIDAFEQAIRLDPACIDAYNNLGLVQTDKNNLAIAAACFETALKHQPEFAIAWSNYGHLLVRMGRVEEGVKALMKTISLSTAKSPPERRMLGYAFGQLGEFDRAREVYEEWLKQEPDDPVAAHHLAAVSGKTPPRADDRYVTAVFESFADSFDEKLAALDYRAPEVVVAEAAAVFGTARGDLRIADAGCGTGLCGPGLKPYAGRLMGVDLSANMIAKARRRGVYDELVVAELTGHFEASRESFDLIVSADTLCYFGDLAPPLAAFHDRLAPGGALVFTVETHLGDDGRDYLLMHHGRYSHRQAYVQQLLERLGFASPTIRSEQLRNETGKPVMGYVVRAARPR